MFPGKNMITFSKVLSGLSKTLNIANQIIPVYNSVVPMINKAKDAFSIIKEINTPTNTVENKQKKITTSIPSNNFNNPKFFI